MEEALHGFGIALAKTEMGTHPAFHVQQSGGTFPPNGVALHVVVEQLVGVEVRTVRRQKEEVETVSMFTKLVIAVTKTRSRVDATVPKHGRRYPAALTPREGNGAFLEKGSSGRGQTLTFVVVPRANPEGAEPKSGLNNCDLTFPLVGRTNESMRKSRNSESRGRQKGSNHNV